MTAIGIGIGVCFGGGSAAAPPVTPLTILAAGGAPLIWLRSDLGITIGTGVSAWADQSGNGHDFLQGTAGNQPAYVASVLNGHAALRFDGATGGAGDFLENTTHVYPAPGTTPTFHWFVLTQITWTAGDAIINSATGFVQEVFCSGSTPNLAQFNGSTQNANNGATVGSPKRIEVYFNNTTSSYIKAGSTNATGGNPGNSAGGGGSRLGRDSALAASNIDLYEYVRLNRLPSAGELTALDAYVTSRYGAGLV